MTQHEYAARVASLNDEFRRRGYGGHVVISEAIRARGSVFVSTAKYAVQAQADFPSEADPKGRHDFGIVSVDGVRICWKIDYQALDNPYAPVNPADAVGTLRVLSLFTPLEY